MSFDPLNDLKNMPPEPKLGENQEKEKDNENYRAETIQNFDEQRTRLASELWYWSFKNSNEQYSSNTPEEETQDTWKTPEQENFKQLEKSPIFPLVKRLYNKETPENSLISEESFQELLQQLETSNWELDLKELKLSDDKDNQKVKDVLKKFEKQTSLNLWKEGDYYQDIKWMEEFSDIFEAFDKKDKDSIDFDLFKLIWENYVRLENPWQEKNNVIEDLGTAIEISSKKILRDFKNIPRDSQTFENAMKNIGSGNLTRQVDWIKSLYLLASAWAWFRAAKTEKQKKAIREKLNPELQKRLKQLGEQIIKAQETANKEIDSKKRQELLEEVDTLKKEKDEVESWEIYSGWKLDKQKNPESPKYHVWQVA